MTYIPSLNLLVVSTKVRIILYIIYKPKTVGWVERQRNPTKQTLRWLPEVYIYNAVGRLRDAQLAGVKELDDKGLQRLRDKNQEGYIKYGALGKAFKNSLRTIVLIDEIDKADIDFPNHLCC